jgi:hypothetical protein
MASDGLWLRLMASDGLWLRLNCDYLPHQLVLIYMDAGRGKALDPARAWSLWAPTAALDTYLRHTPAAVLARAVLGATGLRVAGVSTVRTPSDDALMTL